MRAIEIHLQQHQHTQAYTLTRRGLLEIYGIRGLHILEKTQSDEVFRLDKCAVSTVWEGNDGCMGMLASIHHNDPPDVLTAALSLCIEGEESKGPRLRQRQAVGPDHIRIPTPEGLCMLIFLLAKCHAAMAREVSRIAVSSKRHRQVAIRAMDMLLRWAETTITTNIQTVTITTTATKKVYQSKEGRKWGFRADNTSSSSQSPCIPWNINNHELLLEDIVVHQIVCLAEIGEIAMAIKMTQSALSADRYPYRYDLHPHYSLPLLST